VLIDNTDQTTENGIVFADARSCTAAKSRLIQHRWSSNRQLYRCLLSDDFVDPDAPNPALYPQSILLFNTRRSGYNVKEYRNAYITTAATQVQEAQAKETLDTAMNQLPHTSQTDG
jgi:hypothetical protein